jgi:hypothetical protein
MKAFVVQHPASKAVTASNPIGPGGHARFRAADMILPAGSWVFSAKADVQNVSSPSQLMTINCFLIAFGPGVVRADEDRSDAAVSASSLRQSISLSIGVKTTQSATAELSCSVAFDGKFMISNITLTAIEVEDVNPFPLLVFPIDAPNG